LPFDKLLESSNYRDPEQTDESGDIIHEVLIRIHSSAIASGGTKSSCKSQYRAVCQDNHSPTITTHGDDALSHAPK
jgi:hypothetical protein